MNVESLPGVGPGLASAIRKRFGGDDGFLAAARAADLQAIATVEGISERRAVDLVRAVRGGASDDAFLATPATRAVHTRILESLQSHAGTRHGKNRLRLLEPLAGQEAAQERMRHVLAMARDVAGLDRQGIRAALRHLRPMADPPPRCDTTRLVVAEDHDIHDRLHALGVGRWSILGTPRDLGMAGDMEIVVIAYEDGLDAPELDAVDEVRADAGLAALAPAAVLGWVDHNRPAIEACRRLAALTGKPSVADGILAARDGVQVPRVDLAGLRKALGAACAEAEAAVADALASLSLSGAELLAAMQGGGLPAPVRAAVEEAVASARSGLKGTTGVDASPFQEGLPIRLDEQEVDRIERRIGAHGRLRREHAERAAACAIAGQREALAAEAAAWLEWDADFALGSFAHHLGLGPWRVGDALAVHDAVHLELAADATAQRIHYRIDAKQPVALLTGANSGGKSTLLEQLCQVVVMARLGLPVVGRDVVVPWVDEVHLVTARRGLDAGAFETFLRAFLPACVGDARRIVLADEVESVTELEAAGRILAFFIQRLLETESMGVVVSHVPHAILGHLPPDAVRVDGIQAKGLDGEHRLVVDRQPLLGTLARSTPELIVERLANTTRGAERALYGDLLAAMRPDPHGDAEMGK